jgi:hypothetical protein
MNDNDNDEPLPLVEGCGLNEQLLEGRMLPQPPLPFPEGCGQLIVTRWRIRHPNPATTRAHNNNDKEGGRNDEEGGRNNEEGGRNNEEGGRNDKEEEG